MSSKRDVLETIVTICILAMVVVLTMTGHDSGAVGTMLVGGVGSVLAFWFTRSGFSAGVSSNQTTQQTGLTANDVQNIVNQTLMQAAQTPAQQTGVQTVANQNQSVGVR